ncbi:MAG TPA: sigma factor, partial [Gemmatimonadaceae bacterium]|nr:sigma factor [Gemmatimonadaceae bacterium]
MTIHSPPRRAAPRPDVDSTVRVVHRAQGGDSAAFAELVYAFQDIAVAYATWLLRDFHLAEDAVQEAFVDAHRLLGTLRDPGAFPQWF